MLVSSTQNFHQIQSTDTFLEQLDVCAGNMMLESDLRIQEIAQMDKLEIILNQQKQELSEIQEEEGETNDYHNSKLVIFDSRGTGQDTVNSMNNTINSIKGIGSGLAPQTK